MKGYSKLLMLSLVVLLGSCSKFDEGGKVKNAEDVLTKEWAMERAYKNGNSVEVVNANPQIGEVTENWIFNEDGSCLTEDGESTLKGTWELSSDSKSLIVNITSPTTKASTETYDIVKLTKGTDGELILEQTISQMTIVTK